MRQHGCHVGRAGVALRIGWHLPRRTSASGAGAAAVGGNNYGTITTHVRMEIPVDAPSRSGYIDRVRSLAPADGLLDRKQELDELAAFCAADDFYLWLKADPWAGKTALLSTFALNPPANVDVVAFFVTARLSGQATSDAFTDALLEQLAALAGERLPATLTTGAARDARRRWLLAEAVRAARRNGRTLLILVDGIDEDRGASPGSGIPSIAELLPTERLAGLRVVVASRPGPLPWIAELPYTHPLKQCRVWQLASSPHASMLGERARRELDELLTGGTANRDVLGLATAAGGELTPDDLAELTGLPPFELDQVLGGVFGRTVSEDGRRQGLLFAHETLRVTAVERFGRALAGYRDRINRWADGYRERGWPAETPRYLQRGYVEMLRDSGDLARLTTVVTDATRHDRQLFLSGGDATAVAELRMAQDALTNQPEPDLEALAQLAVHRGELETRNAHIPFELPAVWFMLGEYERASALARGLPGARRGAALAYLAQAAAATNHGEVAAGFAGEAEALLRRGLSDADIADASRALADVLRWLGNPDRAEELKQDAARAEHTVTVSLARSWFEHRETIRLAERQAGDGDHEAAEATLASITSPQGRSAAYALLADAAVRADDFRWAEAAAGRITSGSLADETLSNLALRASEHGEFDLVERVARRIGDVARRAEALLLLLPAGADPSMAALLAEIRATCADIVDHRRRDDLRIALVEAGAALDDGGWSRELLAEIGSERGRIRALATLARGLTNVNPYAAHEALREAEDAARTLRDDDNEQGRTAHDIVVALAVTADHEVVTAASQALSRSVPGQLALRRAVDTLVADGRLQWADLIASALLFTARTDALLVIARAAARAGYAEWAWATATALGDRGGEQARRAIIGALVARGDPASAETFARQCPDAPSRAEALTLVADGWILGGDPVRARAALEETAALAGRLGVSDAVRTVLGLIPIYGALGDVEAAVRLTTTILDMPGTNARDHLRLKPAMVAALAESGDYSAAHAAVADIPDGPDRTQALHGALRSAATAGDINAVVTFSSAIDSMVAVAWALADASERLAASGEFLRAEVVADSINVPERKAWALLNIAERHAERDDRWAAWRLAEASYAAASLITGDNARAEYVVSAIRIGARCAPGQAEELAGTIEDPDLQSRALTVVATNTSDPSTRLVARALCAGHWSTVLPALARAEPDLVVSIAQRHLGIDLGAGAADFAHDR
jgi:hypothetical protein